MMKALLAWAGLKAVPSLHNDAVHAARNLSASAIAGQQHIVRCSRMIADAIATGDRAGADRAQSDIRSTLDTLVKRLDRQ